MAQVISALRARTQFGRLLHQVEREHRSFIVEKRGSPKAIILGVADYVRLAAPEPDILRVLGEASKRRRTDRISSRQIDALIRQTRKEARSERARRAAASARS